MEIILSSLTFTSRIVLTGDNLIPAIRDHTFEGFKERHPYVEFQRKKRRTDNQLFSQAQYQP